MKTPSWTVNPDTGAVSKVGPFSHGLGPVEIQAPTKAAATSALLARYARQQAAGGPRLYVRNGAYAFLTHDGQTWGAESGTVHPARQTHDGQVVPLCSSGGDATPKTALARSSFDYYASEEYQHNERKTYGPLGVVEAETLATLRSVMEWTARESEQIPLERRELLIRNAVRVTLAKIDAAWLAAHDAKDSATPGSASVANVA